MDLFLILLFHQQHTKVRKATPYWCKVFQYRPNLSFITRDGDFKRLLRSIHTFVSCLPSLQCSQHEGSTLDCFDARLPAISTTSLPVTNGAGSGIVVLKQIHMSFVFFGFIIIFFVVEHAWIAWRASCIGLDKPSDIVSFCVRSSAYLHVFQYR